MSDVLIVWNRDDMTWQQFAVLILLSYYWRFRRMHENLKFCCEEHSKTSLTETVQLIAIDQIFCAAVYCNNCFKMPFFVSVIILWKLHENL